MGDPYIGTLNSQKKGINITIIQLNLQPAD